MGLSALNPLSRLRGAVRALIADAVHSALSDTARGLGTAIVADGERTRREITALRARMNFMVEPLPETRAEDVLSRGPVRTPNPAVDGVMLCDGAKPPLNPGDTLNPRAVKAGPYLVDERGRPLGPYEPRHAYAPDRP